MSWERWSVFEFTSGANPFVATRYWKRKKILRRCNRLGYGVKKRMNGETAYYTVDDRRCA